MADSIATFFHKYFDFRISQSELTSKLFMLEVKRKKDFLIQEGDYCRDLFFIVDGYVRIFHYSREGTEITTDISGRGNLVTSIYSLFKKAQSYDNIQCVTPCKIYRLSNTDYKKLRSDDQHWFELGYQILKHNLLKKEERIRQFTKLSARQRYDGLLRSQPDIIGQVPIQYIASYLGMKPESLSRIRHQLAIT